MGDHCMTVTVRLVNFLLYILNILFCEIEVDSAVSRDVWWCYCAVNMESGRCNGIKYQPDYGNI